MLYALQDIFGSKKWIMTFVAMVLVTLGYYHVIPPDLSQLLAAALGVGVVGQSITDHGKGAELVKANAEIDKGDAVRDAIGTMMPLIEKFLTGRDTAHADAYHQLVLELEGLVDDFLAPGKTPPSIDDHRALLSKLMEIIDQRTAHVSVDPAPSTPARPPTAPPPTTTAAPSAEPSPTVKA